MTLEFIVIGAQKAGTTTLWQLLRDHPQLWLPETKEAPFFSHTEVYERGWHEYLDRIGAPAQEQKRLRGTVTPHYMHGWQETPTHEVAKRIAAQLPEVRLIALLRDPIARARSQHAMAVARGREHRSAERALSELLRPEALSCARAAPDDTNSYVVQGEYGRILGEYLSVLPRAALHVELTESLEREPIETVRRILGFLDAAIDYEPPAPFRRAFAGGNAPRVSEEELRRLLAAVAQAPTQALAMRTAEAWLAEHGDIDAAGQEDLRRSVWRYAQAPMKGRSQRERAGLAFELRKIWNVAPAPPEPISAQVRGALAAHFAADTPLLRAATPLRAPWLAPARAAR